MSEKENDDENGWDQFDISDEGIAKLQADNAEKAQALASKYHQVYVQDQNGADLLASMVKSFVMVPIVSADSTQFEAGIKAGRADVVHQILSLIKLAENPGG